MFEDRIICVCQGIDVGSIIDAINKGAETVDDIMEATGAGTLCGACIDEIAEVLEEI